MRRIFSRKLFVPAAVMLLVLSADPYCPAQKMYAPNSIYFELLGNGLIYSINYDRLFNENVGVRIGVMYFPALPSLFSTAEDLVMMPVTLNFFAGNKNHKLEIGAGIVYGEARISTVFSEKTKSGSGVAQTITIGYRYQQFSGGFLFRIGFTPIFRFGEVIIPSGGISVGVSF